MQVRNIKSGEVETLRHGPAVDAVNAGTHEYVNLDEDGEIKEEKSSAAKGKKAPDAAK